MLAPKTYYRKNYGNRVVRLTRDSHGQPIRRLRMKQTGINYEGCEKEWSAAVRRPVEPMRQRRQPV